MARSKGRGTPPEQGDLLGDGFGSEAPVPSALHAPEPGAFGSSPPAVARPLADRLRPQVLADVAGQSHLLGEQGPLTRAITADTLPSMILWGPPGSGKTTLAHVIAQRTSHAFERLNAVLGGVAELRQIVQRATDRRARGQGTIVFDDEIHRFNRASRMPSCRTSRAAC